MKYLCIHGHFYQPPRENAWLGEIDLQDSAKPYHDWNSRICAECYGPNAWARVLNDKQELAELMNNYSLMSFNFGPTLFSWLEKKEPSVYKAILQADKLSQKRFSGHGSAIAQAYNHMILPLANLQDKITQVKWGITDFKKRFNRAPEALWLAETACNTETLCVLADCGLKYVILAPGQCASVRKIGETKWQDVGAKVDPKRAYKCNLPNGKSIAIFFYDGPISQGIAFADTLSSGEKFFDRLRGAYAQRQDPQLVHIATDGETYGHHQKFAEMALAYCLKQVEESSDVKLTVYGEFLEKNPPTYEAKIVENSSWSCFHGIERWRSNCGCNSGRPNWHQKWRGPLREALDFVRNELVKTFEKIGGQYFKDVWSARNDYVELMMDRSLDAQHRFFLKHATEKAWVDRSTALMLLEMQKNALFMYTSCGWFFDEISGIETVQIMQYACRAIELNKKITGVDLEQDFVKLLEKAPSNLRDIKTGATAYTKYVRNSISSLDKIALEYAILACYIDGYHQDGKILYDCEVKSLKHTRQENEDSYLDFGEIVIKSIVTLEQRKFYFVVVNSTKEQPICVITAEDNFNASSAFADVQFIFKEKTYTDLDTFCKEHFAFSYDFSSFSADVRHVFTDSILTSMQGKLDTCLEDVYKEQFPILQKMSASGVSLPKQFNLLAEVVLMQRFKCAFSQPDVNLTQVANIMEELKSLRIILPKTEVVQIITDKLNLLADSFCENPKEDLRVLQLVNYLNLLDIFGLVPNSYKAQEKVFLGIQKLTTSAKQKDMVKALTKKLKVFI